MQTPDPHFPLATYTEAPPSNGASWPAGCRLTRGADGGVAPAGLGTVGEFYSVYPSTGGPIGYTRAAAQRSLLTTGAVNVGDSLYAAAGGFVANTQASGAVFVGTAQATLSAAGLVPVA